MNPLKNPKGRRESGVYIFLLLGGLLAGRTADAACSSSSNALKISARQVKFNPASMIVTLTNQQQYRADCAGFAAIYGATMNPGVLTTQLPFPGDQPGPTLLFPGDYPSAHEHLPDIPSEAEIKE